MKGYRIALFISLFVCSGISLYGQSAGGTLENPFDTVCYGNNHGVLRLKDEIGNILYWEYSTSGSSPWMTINGKTDSLEYNNLTQTTYFRAIVKFGAFPQDTSTVAMVYVSPLSAGGTLTGGKQVCRDNNEGELKLIGYTGDIMRWEYSDNKGISWNPVATTSPSYKYNNLSVTNYFRVIVKSGACFADTSTTAIIEVSPPTVAGTLKASSDTVCYGNNSGMAVLRNYIGDITRWETSETGKAPWSTIILTNDTLLYSGLVQSKYFRVAVRNGSCNELLSNNIAVIVNPPAKGGVISGAREVCAGQNNGTLVLSGHTGKIVKWQSSDDFGTNWKDIINTTHTLNYSGLSKTTLFRAAVQSGSCSAVFSEIATVTVNSLPKVNFDFNIACKTHATTFTNTSAISGGSILNYSWDFGNGNVSHSVNPVYVYPADGSYTVKLTATSDKACIKDTSRVVKVSPLPKVNFALSNKCDLDSVAFSNTSFSAAGGTISYAWNFGDGSGVKTDKNPSHLFPGPGSYDVKLVVTESATGCTDSLAKPVSIFPRATPDFNYTNACVGNTMEFHNNTTFAEGALKYSWAFGDGINSSDINATHTYSSEGEYKVLLTVTTGNNCIDTVSKYVNIFALPKVSFTSQDICFTDTSRFVNNSVISSGMLNYEWDFGNGVKSTEENPLYKYPVPGIYTVSLKATSNGNCTGTAYRNITVYSLPSVNFNVSDVCEGNAAEFINGSSAQSGSMTFLWYFGDGRTSTDTNPVYKYKDPGVYNAKLVARTVMCSDSLTKSVQIYPTPKPDFTAENICDGEPSEFYDRSVLASGTLTGFTWDFGDGSSAVQQNPVHQYLNPGTYTATLSVRSDGNCNATVSKTVVVNYLPVANFSINNVCSGFAATPLNLSTIREGAMRYEWDFGDGYTSDLPAPTHTYNGHGIYQVLLKVISDNGCIDSLIRFVQVYDLPVIHAGDDVTVSRGQSIRLNASGGNNFSWQPSVGLSNPFIHDPLATPVETTQYIVRGEDANMCVNYDTVIVNVLHDYKISPGNIITPDGNGINDFWVIGNINSYEDCEVYIFDRWGNEVFAEKQYNNDWGGTNQNGDILPDGTYYYVVKFAGSDIVYKGAITLLRNK